MRNVHEFWIQRTLITFCRSDRICQTFRSFLDLINSRILSIILPFWIAKLQYQNMHSFKIFFVNLMIDCDMCEDWCCLAGCITYLCFLLYFWCKDSVNLHCYKAITMIRNPPGHICIKEVMISLDDFGKVWIILDNFVKGLIKLDKVG